MKLPTHRQRLAWQLRQHHALSDREVGRIMGITRESANRLINACRRRLKALPHYFAEKTF